MQTEPLDLSHHFLIAMPEMGDPFFSETVTYIFQHTADGAMGFIINRKLKLDMKEVFSSVGINEVISLAQQRPVYNGGPVSTEQGFILHRPTERNWQNSDFNNHLSLTTSLDMLGDIAEGKLPNEFLFCLGYSGWSEGQLEDELKENAWLTVEASSDIVFSENNDDKYRSALASLGIDRSSLSGHGGQA